MHPVIFIGEASGTVVLCGAWRKQDPMSMQGNGSAVQLRLRLRPKIDKDIKGKAGAIDPKRSAVKKTIAALNHSKRTNTSLSIRQALKNHRISQFLLIINHCRKKGKTLY